MSVYVLRKAIETAMHMTIILRPLTISESEFLEEEVNSWLLFVVLVWLVVSIEENKSMKQTETANTYLSVKMPLISFFNAFLVSLLESLSSETTVLSSFPALANSPVTWNLVGRIWL